MVEHVKHVVQNLAIKSATGKVFRNFTDRGFGWEDVQNREVRLATDAQGNCLVNAFEARYVSHENELWISTGLPGWILSFLRRVET